MNSLESIMANVPSTDMSIGQMRMGMSPGQYDEHTAGIGLENRSNFYRNIV
jgi:hypothetical protein